MIKLSMMNYTDGTSVPISLEVENRIYIYGEDDLFVHLNKYIGYKIRVYNAYMNRETKIKDYIINDVFDKAGIPAIDLKE